jgi:glycerol-3-phosphate dehydrogenase
LNAQAALEALPRVIEIMKEELQWDDNRCKKEHADALEYLQTMGLDTNKSRAQFKSEEIVHFRDDFKALDLDGDGAISTHDLSELFRHQGYPKVKEEILKSLIAEVDLNRNGVVDFNEFLEVKQASLVAFDYDFRS